jgi:hypothetical protein
MECLPQQLGSLALDKQVYEDHGNEMGYKVKIVYILKNNIDINKRNVA